LEKQVEMQQQQHNANSSGTVCVNTLISWCNKKLSTAVVDCRRQVSIISASNRLCNRSTVLVCVDCYRQKSRRLAGQMNQGMSYSWNGQWRDGPGSSTRQVGITSGRLLVSREFQKQEWTSLSPPHFVI